MYGNITRVDIDFQDKDKNGIISRYTQVLNNFKWGSRKASGWIDGSPESPFLDALDFAAAGAPEALRFVMANLAGWALVDWWI